MPNWIVKFYNDHSMNDEAEANLREVELDRYTGFFPGLSSDHLKEQSESFLITVIDLTDDDKLIGLVRGHSMWQWVYVRTLWVDDIYRSEGVGSELLKEVQKLVLERGCHGIHLETWNQKNLLFYEKNGFQLSGAIEDFPKNCIRFSLYKRVYY